MGAHAWNVMAFLQLQMMVCVNGSFSTVDTSAAIGSYENFGGAAAVGTKVYFAPYVSTSHAP